MCSSLRITCILAVCVLALSDAHQDQWKASGKKASRVKENVNEESARGDEDSWWPSAEFAVLQKVYDDCSAHHEITKCLKSKALNALSRAIEQVGIENDTKKYFGLAHELNWNVFTVVHLVLTLYLLYVGLDPVSRRPGSGEAERLPSDHAHRAPRTWSHDRRGEVGCSAQE